jgi:hypothetical protein
MKRAGFTCKGEAVISASMNTILPTCLGELTGKNSESTSPLPGLPTHVHWTSKGGQLGRRCDISHCLANVKPTLENQQRDYFAGNWMGGAVAKELLSKAFAHWTYFQTMLDDFFMEFSASGSKTEAWKLTCMIGKAFLEAAHLLRCLAADLSDLQSPSQRAARILWATLQAHRVFDDFIKAEYRHNPCIAPIIVLHLLENRISRAEIETLSATVTSQAAAISKLRKDIDSITSKMNKGKPA